MRSLFQKYTLFVFLLFLTICTFSQSVEEIRTSGKYNWGIGIGSNYPAARRFALQRLSESITVQITSQFTEVVKETGDDHQSFVEKIVTSYSATVVNNYEEKILKEEPGNVEVLIYIAKQDLQKVFKQREQTIGDFINQGIKAEEELRISDALRYYYWALVLTRSHPDNVKLRHTFDTQTEQPVMIGLYDRINRIFTFLRIEVSSVKMQEDPLKKEMQLAITIQNKPVQDLDYTHFLGDTYSGTISVRDGRGIAILEGPSAKELKNLNFRIEYQYANKAHLEPEVKFMMENVTLPYFEKSQIRVNIEKENPIATEAVRKEAEQKPQLSFESEGTAEQKTLENIVEQVVLETKKRNFNALKASFTDAGYEMYTKLIANGKVTILDRAEPLRILKIGDEIQVRSIPMLFAYENNNVKFVENVVFTFNKDLKINCLSYELGTKATQDILAKPTGFGTQEEKYFLIKFMEDYKTAFALKRLEYIQSIFDDNALIIVGHTVKQTEQQNNTVSDIYQGLGDEKVKYIRLSKSEYMDRLKNGFNRNQFINIRFEGNEVRKTQGKDKIYGIQIEQYYHSSTYADKGYLFLMIDLNDIQEPKIYVRTWQPEKNADGSIFGLEDFKLK